MRDFVLIEETLGYVTAEQVDNTDPRYLVSGSQNVLIDRNRKVKTRGGYSRLGASNSALTPVRKGITWNNSTGGELPIRFYDDEMEVYIGTVDGTDVNAWTRIEDGWNTTNIPRLDTWFDTGENIDLLLFVQGDDNIYEWGGGIAIVSSFTTNTITKTGTNTFAQNRFYVNRNRTVVNARTGVEYTYTGGAGTTQITGVSPDPTGDLVAGDILIQKVVTQSNKPAADRINDTLFVFENQLVVGSFTDNEVYISQNDDYDDFSFSAPRVAGEGGLLTLDGPSGGFGALSTNLVAFAGRSSIFKAQYTQISVGTTLAETLGVKRLKTGVDQGSLSPDCIVPIGNGLVYMSHESALRELNQTQLNDEPDLRTLSNPIKPDFDAEDFTGTQGIWAKNAVYITSPVNSRLYILEFVEDADGKLRRFWQPPQLLPVQSLSIIGGALHGHSNSVAETYKLFDTFSDINSTDDKLPINAIAVFSYRTFESTGRNRALLKNFDEYFVEGEISPSTTDLLLTLQYGFGGHIQNVERTIDGTDSDILEEELVGAGLGQVSLGQQPLGGSMDAPSDSRKFRVIFEIAREDFSQIRPIFSTNEVDRYWSIIAHGPNVARSTRRDTTIKK